MLQEFNIFSVPLYRKPPEKYKFEKSPVTSVTGIHDIHITSCFPVTTSVFSSFRRSQRIIVFFQNKKVVGCGLYLQSFYIETRFNFCHIPIFTDYDCNAQTIYIHSNTFLHLFLCFHHLCFSYFTFLHFPIFIYFFK